MGIEGKIQRQTSETMATSMRPVSDIDANTIVLREGIPCTVKNVNRDASGDFTIVFNDGSRAVLSGDDFLECLGT